MASQYDRQRQILERRQQLAEALRASGNEALPVSLDSGRIHAPVSGWAHADKALKQILGGLSERQVNKDVKKLDEEEAKAQADWIAGLHEAQAPSELQPQAATGDLLLAPGAEQSAQESLQRRLRGQALRGDVQAQVDAGDRSKLLAHLMKGGDVGGLPAAVSAVGIQRELLPPVVEDFTLGQGDTRISGRTGKVIASGEPKPTPDVRTDDIKEWELAKAAGYAGSLQEWILEQKKAGANQTNLNMPPQEKAFEMELGKEQAKAAVESKAAAEDAAMSIATVQQGREILRQGIISGFGANTLVTIGQALRQAGFSVAEGDLENTQAYASSMGANVGRIIKLFGAGTGLSDADREYARQISGGEVTLDEKALRKILDINEKAARNVVERHNKQYGKVSSTIPLTVSIPDMGAGTLAPPSNATETAAERAKRLGL